VEEKKMSPLRCTKLFPLILLLGVMVAVVTATEQKTPDLTLKTSGAIEPAALYAATAPGENAGTESMPSKMDLSGFGNDSPSFNPQIADIKDGLTVAVNRSVTVEADEAYVVVTPTAIYSSSGNPQPISSENRTAVIAKLGEIGIAKEDIEFESQPYSSPIVSVQVQINELPQIGQLVLDAVEAVLGDSESHGVHFSLSQEKCDQALALARRQAVPQADKTAADLAEALSIKRGSIVEAVESPFMNFAYGPINLDACGLQFQDPYVVEVEPFDAEPKAEVAVGLQVSYGVEPP
jgi:uncharacterized protein DUF541